MYQIVFERRVFKDLDKIPSKDIDKIKAIFDDLKLNPRSAACKKLTGSAPARFRIRKGVYRIVFIVEDKTKTVKIMLVRHRKDVYRKW